MTPEQGIKWTHFMEGKGWSLTRERRNRLEDARCLAACLPRYQRANAVLCFNPPAPASLPISKAPLVRPSAAPLLAADSLPPPAYCSVKYKYNWLQVMGVQVAASRGTIGLAGTIPWNWTLMSCEGGAPGQRNHTPTHEALHSVTDTHQLLNVLCTNVALSQLLSHIVIVAVTVTCHTCHIVTVSVVFFITLLMAKPAQTTTPGTS